MSDCVAKNRAEIGIYTLPEYRRQGLATIAAAAAVEYCLDNGIESVGWHCNDGNIASQRTAEKVGFEFQKTFKRHYIVRPKCQHYAELGLRDFYNGDFESCISHYRMVFDLTHQAENYLYHLAAIAAGKIGKYEQSLTWLREAAERGWKNHAYTESRREFELLKGSLEWKSILILMKKS